MFHIAPARADRFLGNSMCMYTYTHTFTHSHTRQMYALTPQEELGSSAEISFVCFNTFSHTPFCIEKSPGWKAPEILTKTFSFRPRVPPYMSKCTHRHARTHTLCVCVCSDFSYAALLTCTFTFISLTSTVYDITITLLYS